MDGRILIGFIAMALLLPGMARAQERSRATAQVSATIIIPLTATEASTLNFGRFYPGSDGGTIAVKPDGSVNTSSTVVADVSERNPGSFLVTGQSDATVVVSLPQGSATLTGANGSASMEVTDWAVLPEEAVKGMKLDGGSQTVMIGATLRVGSIDENPKGTYTGTYQVTFAYN